MRNDLVEGLCGVLICGVVAFGCSSSNGPSSDGGPGGAGGGSPDAPGNDDGGVTFKAFTTPADPGPGKILFAASGEVLALTGYGFPPNPSDAPAFVDGWQVEFTRLLVTLDKVKISSNPDVDPGNQALTGPVPGSVGGDLLAEVDGPWAVDLAHNGAENIAGKGDPGVMAVPVAVLANQNQNGNKAFATDGTRYAFGFDVVTAQSGVYNVNLDAAAQADYAEMVSNQCAVFYVGTATFKGGTVPGYESCNAGHTAADGWPAPGTPVTFRLCFKSPTTYANCQNADLTATPLPGEDFERGIPLSSSQSTLAQITIHTDHPFWDSVLHDSPAHFDQFAARLVGQADAGAPVVSLEMTKGVNFSAYTDALGNVLQWRYCLAPPTDVHNQLTGVMAFDPQNLPRANATDPATAGLRDYYDFATYNQSTQGHLNADGLCAVIRNYASPN
jgi:hypothetical protein